MNPILAWLIMVAAIVILIVAILIRRERRLWQSCASWTCPQCGSNFGHQSEQREWGVKANPPPPSGTPILGPLLRCHQCHSEFQFSWLGEHVTYWKGKNPIS